MSAKPATLIQSIPVILSSPNSTGSTRGEVQVESWDPKGRFRRCLRFWGISWGMAIVCVFIPGLHFILVPSLLVAGPIVAYFVYQQKTMVKGGSGTCPACGEPFQIVMSKLKWPLNDVCAKCHDAVVISQAE